METVEVVIRLSKNYYDAFKNAQIMTSGMRSGKTYFQILVDALCEGIVLPKGHGELIDRQKLLSETYTMVEEDSLRECDILFSSNVENAPTVIEADREGEDESD